MRKAQVTVYLDHAQADLLDRRAARARVSRSTYIGRLVVRDLADADGVPELLYPAYAMRKIMLHVGGTAMVDDVDAEFDAMYGPGAALKLLGLVDPAEPEPA